MIRSIHGSTANPKPCPVADQLARALFVAVKAGHSKKQLFAAVAALLTRMRAQCRRCHHEWPVTLLRRNEIQHICLVARRSNFLTLRRRIQDQLDKVRLACSSCAERARNDGREETQANDQSQQLFT